MQPRVHNFDEKGEDIRLPGCEEVVLHGAHMSLELHEIEVKTDRARA